MLVHLPIRHDIMIKKKLSNATKHSSLSEQLHHAWRGCVNISCKKILICKYLKPGEGLTD